MANTLPTTMEYFDNLLGEQLTECGGGGDFTTAQVTFNVIGNATATLEDFYEIADLPGGRRSLMHADECVIDLSYAGTTYTIPLVDGVCYQAIFSSGTIATSGNAEYLPDDDYLLITGDCTITIS